MGSSEIWDAIREFNIYINHKNCSIMLSNKLQARVYYDIAFKGNSYHVNYYMRVSSRFAARFDNEHPAPTLLANQLTCFNNTVSEEDVFFKISTKSDLTPLIQEWDTKRDNNTSSIRAMAQAYALNPGDAQKQADGQRVLDLMKHYAMSNDDNYENQGSKTLQFTQAIDASTTLTAAIANIGATTFYQDLKEANEQCRLLIDQRNAERAEAPQQNMVELRKRTDMEYRDLIMILNAFALTDNTATSYRGLINILNEDINYYEKTVFAGSGSGSSGGSGTSEPTNPSDPNTPNTPNNPNNPSTPNNPTNPTDPTNPTNPGTGGDEGGDEPFDDGD